MGFWGTALLSNDTAEDVRDSYIQLLEQKCSNEAAYTNILEEYAELMGTDEEPLLWYALADTMWRAGRLTTEAKEKALFWISREGGLDLWEGNTKREAAWRGTLAKLKARLETPQRKEKKILSHADIQFIPGRTGDVFAYRFHSKEAEKEGYYGKYILMQQIGIVDDLYPQMLFFDKIYEEIPEKVDLASLRILPYDNADAYSAADRRFFNKLTVSAYLSLYHKRSSPQKHLTCLGNFPLQFEEPVWHWNRQSYGWDTYTFETTTMCYHQLWQAYDYRFGDIDTVTRR